MLLFYEHYLALKSLQEASLRSFPFSRRRHLVAIRLHNSLARDFFIWTCARTRGRFGDRFHMPASLTHPQRIKNTRVKQQYAGSFDEIKSYLGT